MLDLWDSEFHKAFQSLRNGSVTPLLPRALSKAQIRGFITELKRMTPEHYWLTTRRLSVEMGNPVNLSRPPRQVDRWWAQEERDNEIRSLEQQLSLRDIEAQGRRRKIWDVLIKADTYAAVRKACGRWARLPDVRRTGTTTFPEYALQNAAQFLSMKTNKRFPRSTSRDDARIDYLARGMAGVLAGRSAMTGIERLRNMKHGPGGPLWITREGDYVLPANQQYCGCWRCKKANWNNVATLSQAGYENGLQRFIELAATTRVPKDWSTSKRL